MSRRDALLAQIYADVENDAPRMVYADWLLEQGETDRAFVIQTQLNPRAEEHDVDRAHELVREHWREWVGPASEGIGRVFFERGFMSECTMTTTTHAHLARDPVFSTMTILRSDLPDLLIHSGMKALRELASEMSTHQLTAIAELPFELGVTTVRVSLCDWTPEYAARLSATNASVFSALRQVRCQIEGGKSLAWLAGSWIAERATSLSISDRSDGDRPPTQLPGDLLRLFARRQQRDMQFSLYQLWCTVHLKWGDDGPLVVVADVTDGERAVEVLQQVDGAGWHFHIELPKDFHALEPTLPARFPSFAKITVSKQ